MKPTTSKQPYSLWQKFVSWFDSYGLIVIVGFLLAFIPLYPKIPSYSPIEQYNVRVRLEDFLILGASVIWLVQWFRGKARWSPGMTWLIFAYIVVSFLSVLNAIFIIKTVPIQPLLLGKTILHFLRYGEYFSLFFIAYSAVTDKKQLKTLFLIISGTLAAIAIYGFGQRYWYWPVYSTMNREFSKGIRLYLTENARVQSTFAGHYDLGAYLVVILPIVLAFAFVVRNKLAKILLHVVHWAGVWLLVETASRTSFAAYLVGVAIVLTLLGWQKTTWSQKITWTSSRGLAVGLAMIITLMIWGQGMYERFIQVLEGYPGMYQTYTDLNAQRKQFVDQNLPGILDFGSWSNSGIASVPENGLSTEEAERIIVSSDQRPVKDKPSDVYVDVPDLVPVEVATISATGAATTTTIIEERDRVFSQCAIDKGLSLCIRLETLWPQAVAGFMRSPLFGSGYATLNKAKVTDFTEADSTDNNFLRTLGETGLLGFITFYGAVALAIGYAVVAYKSKDQQLQTFAIGFLAASVGLLINAMYIDVYASSKIAYTYWMLAGILLAYITLEKNKPRTKTSSRKKK